MILPKAHTACSQTFWWGECSSLRKSGTASEKYKQNTMQLLRNTYLRRQNYLTQSFVRLSPCGWELVKALPDDTELKHCVTIFPLLLVLTELKITWHLICFKPQKVTKACQNSKLSYTHYTQKSSTNFFLTEPIAEVATVQPASLIQVSQLKSIDYWPAT